MCLYSSISREDIGVCLCAVVYVCVWGWGGHTCEVCVHGERGIGEPEVAVPRETDAPDNGVVGVGERHVGPLQLVDGRRPVQLPRRRPGDRHRCHIQRH